MLALGVLVFGSAGISYAEQLFCKKVSCKFYGHHPSAVYGKNETTCSYLKKEMYFNYSYIKKQNYKWYDSKNYVNCSIGELCEGSNSRSTYQLNNKVLNITTNGFISEMYGDFNMQSQYNCKIVGQNQNPKIANKSKKNKSTISSQSWSLPDCPSTYLFNNCYGSFTWENGDKYLGEWKNSDFHGKGTFTFKDNRKGKNEEYKYVGDFKKNQSHGRGTFIFSNGDEYEGEYKNGLEDGYGIIKYKNGKIKEGIWKYGVFINISSKTSQNPFSSDTEIEKEHWVNFGENTNNDTFYYKNIIKTSKNTFYEKMSNSQTVSSTGTLCTKSFREINCNNLTWRYHWLENYKKKLCVGKHNYEQYNIVQIKQIKEMLKKTGWQKSKKGSSDYDLHFTICKISNHRDLKN